MPAICEAIQQYAVAFLETSLYPPIPAASPASILATMLSDRSALVAPKPLVVLFDKVDVAVLYGGVWTVIEIKLVSRRGRETTIEQGLSQISRYRDTVDPQAAR